MKIFGLLMAAGLVSVAASAIKRDTCEPSTVTVSITVVPTTVVPSTTISTVTETSRVETTITVHETRTEVLTLVGASTAPLNTPAPAAAASGSMTYITELVIPLATPVSQALTSTSEAPQVSTSTVTEHYYQTVTEVITLTAEGASTIAQAAPISATSTHLSTFTSVVHVTSTLFLTSVVTTRESSAFPTLTVTGSMGFEPSGNIGNGTSFQPSGTAGTAISGATTPAPADGRITPLPVVSSEVPSTSLPSPVMGGAATENTTGVDVSSTVASFLNSTSTISYEGYGYRKRQVGATVTATIDGVVVSWINSWDGGMNPVTTSFALSTSSAKVVGGYTVQPLPAPTSSSLVTSTSSANLAGGYTVQPLPTPTSTSLVVSLSSTKVVGGSTVQPLSAPTSTLTATATMLSVSSLSTQAISTSKTPVATTSIRSVLSTSTSEAVSSSSVRSVLSTITSKAVSSSSAVVSSAQPTSIPQTTSQALTLSSFMTSPVVGPLPTSSRTVVPTPPFTNTTSTTTAATATASCGNTTAKPFTINFDDLPRFGEAPTGNQYPPILNPYHHLFWSEGFAYVPPPSDPYPPHSGRQLAMFVVDSNANVHSQNFTGAVPSGEDVNGMFGAGPMYTFSSSWFDAHSVWLGCQNAGPRYCQLLINGFGLDDTSQTSVLKYEQYFYQEPCPSLTNCQLMYVEFDQGAFQNLTALQVVATVFGDEADTPLAWYMDDLTLSWSDNSCAAAVHRSGG